VASATVLFRLFLLTSAAGMDDRIVQSFIDRWKDSGGAERANYQLFLAELCDVLEVPRPEPTVEEEPQNAYVFEKNVVFNNRDGEPSQITAEGCRKVLGSNTLWQQYPG